MKTDRIEILKSLVSKGQQKKNAQQITEAEFDTIVAFVEDTAHMSGDRVAEVLKNTDFNGPNTFWTLEILWGFVDRLD